MLFKRILWLCAGLLTVFGLAACGQKVTTTTPPSVSLVIDAAVLELSPGDSHTLSAAVTADGVSVSNAHVQWSSSDASVVTVQEGEVTAVAEGTAAITASATWGDWSGTATVSVIVSREVIDIQPEAPVILDLSTQTGGGVAFKLPVDKEDAEYILVGDTELRIFPQGDDVLVDASALLPGEYTMTLIQGKQQIRFPAYVVTAVIRSAKELQKATSMENADTGYFILGNNIDCKEIQEPVCFLEQSYFETSLGENRQGFRGGFNGMGYTISNLQVPKNGLFGCIGASGTVRDIGFVNISSPDVDASVLCRDSAGLINQVYVQGDFSRAIYASYGPTNRLENIVAESTRSGAILCQHIASVDTEGYSVSEVSALIMVGQEAQVSGWSRIQKFSNLTMDTILRVCSRETRDSIPSVTAEYGFNDYWDITSGYPVFISSIQ